MIGNRAAFTAVEQGEGDWLAVAAEFASTHEGRAHLMEEMLPVALLTGDGARQAAIHCAVLLGERIRAASDEAARVGRTRTRSASPEELVETARQFGVARAQVLRDHAISHVLGALSASDLTDDLVFYGVRRSRTLLPRLRLSEDIDLIAHGHRRGLAEGIETTIQEGLTRSHGRAVWDPPLQTTRGAEPAVLVLPRGVSIKIQMMKADDLPARPTERSTIIQRYSDAPPAALRTFTSAAFVAAKTTARADRSAPRDLYDLWALSRLGMINTEALKVFRRYGGTGGDPQPRMFRHAPDEQIWSDALAHQGQIRLSPTVDLNTVSIGWRDVVGG